MHMLHRRRRLAASFLAIGLLAATLFTVDSLTFPSPAEARCNGVGNPVTSTFIYGGHTRVAETPVSGTCNGNNLYRGVLKDTYPDPYCVSVEFYDAGWWYELGYVCGSGNSSSFSWQDINGNSRVYQQFCLYREGVFVACGWGSDVDDPGVAGDGYGVNHGF
jgi:hypothetical protein